VPLTQTGNTNLVFDRILAFDQAMAFASGQTITASGYVNNIQAQVDMQGGRHDGYWILDVSALKLSAGDETYRLHLLGSNDSAFGNGNVEILATRDFAAASSGRLVPTVAPASYSLPPSGSLAGRFSIPHSNFSGLYCFRYLQCYAVLGGTSPSITLTSWLSADWT
jgi:hypothetical protein